MINRAVLRRRKAALWGAVVAGALGISGNAPGFETRPLDVLSLAQGSLSHGSATAGPTTKGSLFHINHPVIIEQFGVWNDGATPPIGNRHGTVSRCANGPCTVSGDGFPFAHIVVAPKDPTKVANAGGNARALQIQPLVAPTLTGIANIQLGNYGIGAQFRLNDPDLLRNQVASFEEPPVTIGGLSFLQVRGGGTRFGFPGISELVQAQRMLDRHLLLAAAEPATLALFGFGLLALGGMVRSRRHQFAWNVRVA